MEKFTDAREGFNKSIEKAKEADEKNYPVIGYALRKMGEDPDADDDAKEYADDGKIFIATDRDNNFTAFDHLTWDEIEDELSDYPEYTELYYTDACGEGASESAQYLLENEWPECEAGTDQAVSAVLAGKEDDYLYDGDHFPSIKIEMFYNGNLFHSFTL